MPTRRDFLNQCALVGLGLAVPLRFPTRGRAESKKDDGHPGPYYVVLNASGGWDTTYLMDPKGVNEINRLYRQGDITTRGAHTFAPTAKHIEIGLSNEDFYTEFGDDLLVLNGLDYSVNNHSPGARYMATGKLDSLAYPTFAAASLPPRQGRPARSPSSRSATTPPPGISWPCPAFRTLSLLHQLANAVATPWKGTSGRPTTTVSPSTASNVRLQARTLSRLGEPAAAAPGRSTRRTCCSRPR